jgi:hypothetical protein
MVLLYVQKALNWRPRALARKGLWCEKPLVNGVIALTTNEISPIFFLPAALAVRPPLATVMALATALEQPIYVVSSPCKIALKYVIFKVENGNLII